MKKAELNQSSYLEIGALIDFVNFLASEDMLPSTIACKAERRLGVLRRNLRKLAAVQKAKSREVRRTKMVTESTISNFYDTPAVQNIKQELTKKPDLLSVKATTFELIPFSIYSYDCVDSQEGNDLC